MYFTNIHNVLLHNKVLGKDSVILRCNACNKKTYEKKTKILSSVLLNQYYQSHE